jgi:glucokinase
VTLSVVGVDLGGTKVAVATKCGRELGESQLQPTRCTNTHELIDQVVGMVQAIKPENLDGVGVGVPSVVEFETGRVVSSVNIPLAEVSLREVLGERLGVPVFVDNDATVAALAEAHDDELRLVAHNLVMITVGTGIGGGLVLGGRIYRGATGGAGELGHTLVGLDLAGAVPAPMSFPQPGSLEFVASGHALDRLAVQAAALHPRSALGALRAEGKPVLGPDAVEAAHAGDPDARRMVEIWGQRVGVGVANAINTFDPEEVVIGGGAAQAGDLLLEPARRVARGYVLPGLGGKTTIRLARHGVRAGVLGAALLAEHELEARPPASAGGGSAAGSADEPPVNPPTTEVSS